MPPKRARAVSHLEDLPNVGKATAADLRAIHLTSPSQLVGQDPYRLYERMNRVLGARQDPCMCDVLISVVRYMEGAPARPWWHYTAERKRTLAQRSR
ncbi:MAG: helix-hairpin-helix domain-containing protein [Gemmatimonadaceae bacterium]